ncbi:MAG TPA: substrate-binding domain-containing protein [Acetobacteraceae bacterium]|nr:substrate-binding domain-containing protein [Acetobacteraceae bacterium]
MRKVPTLGVAAAVLTASLGGAAFAAGGGKLTIAYIQKQGDQQYFVDEAAGARDAATKLGNVKVDVVNVGTDSNAAISAMNVMIGQKVDGIAIVVPDQQIGPQVIDMAKQAKIPLIASDDPIKSGTGQPAPFVGFDSYEMGYKVGFEAGQLYKAAGWTADATRIAAPYKQELSDCQERESGQEAGFAKAAGGPAPRIIKIGTDNSAIDAQNRTAAVVTANPGIKHWVVWGCNDESETGAVTALANAGMPADNIIGVGLGAYLDCKDWQAGQASGNKAALFISGHDVGSAAVTALVDAIRTDKPLPPKTIAKTTIVTPQNWKSVMGSCS